MIVGEVWVSSTLRRIARNLVSANSGMKRVKPYFRLTTIHIYFVFHFSLKSFEDNKTQNLIILLLWEYEHFNIIMNFLGDSVLRIIVCI